MANGGGEMGGQECGVGGNVLEELGLGYENFHVGWMDGQGTRNLMLAVRSSPLAVSIGVVL